MELQLPSKEEKLNVSSLKHFEGEVWMKRDDLIHPFISGNKWRKLAPLIALAKEREMKTLVSFGGAWSNHLLALAAAANLHHLKSKAYVRGDTIDNPVLSQCRSLGMELEFLDRESYREIRSKLDHLTFKSDELWIPEGANCKEAHAGMQTLWMELNQSYDIVLDSVGSGTSVRGLFESKPSETRLLGIMAVKDTALAAQLRSEGLEIFEEYAGKGFARVDTNLLELCARFREETGIVLDPVYTSKQWRALLDLIDKGIIRGKRILFIHSGGQTGWWSGIGKDYGF